MFVVLNRDRRKRWQMIPQRHLDTNTASLSKVCLRWSKDMARVEWDFIESGLHLGHAVARKGDANVVRSVTTRC